jgi:hypothetical protein
LVLSFGWISHDSLCVSEKLKETTKFDCCLKKCRRLSVSKRTEEREIERSLILVYRKL